MPAGSQAAKFCLTGMVTQASFFLERVFTRAISDTMEKTGKRHHPMLGTILTVVGFLAVWLLLQRVILPRLGVST